MYLWPSVVRGVKNVVCLHCIGHNHDSDQRIGVVTSANIPRYQVAIDIRRKNPLIVERGAPLVAKFTENLVPGKTYQVIFFLTYFS